MAGVMTEECRPPWASRRGVGLIEDAIEALGEEAGVELPRVAVTGRDPGLPSVFDLGSAAAISVGAATAAAAAIMGRRAVGRRAESPPTASVDVREAAAAFADERHFRVDGRVQHLWAPLSGDYRTADGWVRLHCNFDHHRDAALDALGLTGPASREQVEAECARRGAEEIERAVLEAGGCAAAMRDIERWRAHPQARALADVPLVRGTRLDDARPIRLDPSPQGGRQLAGIRVLDLTRVIAGPVAARTLAAHGADVLRVGAAHLPEVPGLVVSTAFGKRSCHLDLRSIDDRRAFAELVAGADILIQAYRPGALAALGFGPEALAALRPGIVSVEISAYGGRGPWARRRGFDSLVQMSTGIAHEGGDGISPRPLPVQALDHATGYLAAFGAMAALLRRAEEGGSRHVELSLARTACWLDGLGRVDEGGDGGHAAGPEVADRLAEMDSPFGRLTYVRPPGRVHGLEPHWSAPPPRPGEHPPRWW
jgi:crotonobetainyl-CoA:carnitine CoA-transferase CaiB-like acyl-CoA transferase